MQAYFPCDHIASFIYLKVLVNFPRLQLNLNTEPGESEPKENLKSLNCELANISKNKDYLIVEA